jgi:hypothetical protein
MQVTKKAFITFVKHTILVFDAHISLNDGLICLGATHFVCVRSRKDRIHQFTSKKAMQKYLFGMN